MIYTAILMRDSYLDNDGGYINGYTDADVRVRTFTRLSDMRGFIVPFLVASRFAADKDRNLSYHEVSILVNGIPGKGLSFSGEIEYSEGLESSGAALEASDLEKEIDELVRKEYLNEYTIRARKANEERLAADRHLKEANERRERTQYENLRKKFEGA